MNIEVVFALPYEQKIIQLEMPEGSTAQQAVERSGLFERYPDWNIEQLAIGIFAEKVLEPENQILESGDRVEIYRPLLIDPKAARRERAAKASQK